MVVEATPCIDISNMDVNNCEERQDVSYIRTYLIWTYHPQSGNQTKSMIEKKYLGFPYEEKKNIQKNIINAKTKER